MRGAEPMNPNMFSYVDIDASIPKDPVIRRMRVFVDAILKSMSPEFDARYSHTGRPSIPPERLLQALLIQVLYTVRSERPLIKTTGSAMDGRTVRGQGYALSLRRRKMIEEAFGWIKTIGGLRKTRHKGLAKLSGEALLCFAAYKLTG